jgi:hypothetical protein
LARTLHRLNVLFVVVSAYALEGVSKSMQEALFVGKLYRHEGRFAPWCRPGANADRSDASARIDWAAAFRRLR